MVVTSLQPPLTTHPLSAQGEVVVVVKETRIYRYFGFRGDPLITETKSQNRNMPPKLQKKYPSTCACSDISTNTLNDYPHFSVI